MYLRVQFSSVGIGSAGDKALICRGDGKGVQVRIHGLRNGQDQRENPDGCGPQDDAGSGDRSLDIQGFHYGPVPVMDRHKKRHAHIVGSFS